MIDPDLLARASLGDDQAEADLALALAREAANGEMPVADAMAAAFIYGSRAGATGKAQHLISYAGVLLAFVGFADEEFLAAGGCDEEQITALAIFDALADAGHVQAELAALAMASNMSPELIAEAGRQKVHVPVQPLTTDELDRAAAYVEAFSRDIAPCFAESR